MIRELLASLRLRLWLLVLMALAHVPAVRDGDAAECDRFLSALLKDNPLYTVFGVADLAGDIICSAIRLTKPVNIADRAYFLEAMETRDFSIGEFHIGRTTDRRAIGFGYPVLDADGRVQAVVAAAMDLSWLNQLMVDAELPEGALLLVIDRNGTILYGYPISEAWIGESDLNAPLFQTMLTQGQDAAEL